ncbi:hypothetical protein LSTR_LSTR002952 [Laodelphax striatellus]|uniref:Ig-like domain-containing protein n=1 Tax=Laodelphax striatellus TaxID=195883 RepID=A0A482XM67_LAOST|nr:hypothetical protein LSTR_LSTR002952 [Laodelphax striatellus]
MKETKSGVPNNKLYFYQHVATFEKKCAEVLNVSQNGISFHIWLHPSQTVEAVVGGSAKFPCNISSVTPDDTMALVIWFKGEIPIYSYDLRDGGELEDAKHWAAEDIIDRAQYTVSPSDSHLVLESVMEMDEGQIKCRIDFYHTPTRNSFFNLTVTVPPASMELTDHTGRAVVMSTMPVIEGESLQIICLALGGKPIPKVRWMLNDVLIDESDEQMSGNKVRNVLVLDNLQRRHLGSQLTCEASNTKLIPPLSTTVSIELYLRPLEVKLLGENLALSAGSKYEVACRCSGSRPPANITWWKGGQSLRGFTRETMSSDGNVTLGTLTIDPQPDDSGKTLSCRTSNIHYPSVELEDSWILNVHFAPIISLNVRNDTNASRIREGMDVHLECRIQANPPVDKILWTYNGEELSFNSSSRKTQDNQTLMLKSVTRGMSGIYTCLTSNAEGDSASDPFLLDVKYEPSCTSKQEEVHGTARGEELVVACSVEANPPATRFKWTFNSSSSSSSSSSGNTSSFSLDSAETSGGRSVLTYRPLLESDFGTIFGGLRQAFVVEVQREGRLVANVSSRLQPEFVVSGLEPGVPYTLHVYATNEKGRSNQAVTLSVATQGHGNTQHRRTEPAGPVYLLEAILSGVIIVSLVLGCAVGVMIRYSRSRRSPSPHQTTEPGINKSIMLLGLTTAIEDDKNPDLIPHSNDPECTHSEIINASLLGQSKRSQWDVAISPMVGMESYQALTAQFGLEYEGLHMACNVTPWTKASIHEPSNLLSPVTDSPASCYIPKQHAETQTPSHSLAQRESAV